MMSKTLKLVYCDYLATLIHQTLLTRDTEHLIDQVGKIQFDLGLFGEYCSSTKTIDVLDMFGKQYRITIQEL
jgi:hypothetical protein